MPLLFVAPFSPFFQAPNYTSPDYRIDLGSSSKCNTKMAMRAPASNISEERIVNRRETPSTLDLCVNFHSIVYYY